MISLSCGKKYIGKTGRCLNGHFKEHFYNANTTVQDNLGTYCRDCGCQPDFKKSTIVSKHREQLTQEITEVDKVQQRGDLCISMPSAALSENKSEHLAVCDGVHDVSYRFFCSCRLISHAYISGSFASKSQLKSVPVLCSSLVSVLSFLRCAPCRFRITNSPTLPLYQVTLLE